jgi:hypothetical protein
MTELIVRTLLTLSAGPHHPKFLRKAAPPAAAMPGTVPVHYHVAQQLADETLCEVLSPRVRVFVDWVADQMRRAR